MLCASRRLRFDDTSPCTATAAALGADATIDADVNDSGCGFDHRNRTAACRFPSSEACQLGKRFDIAAPVTFSQQDRHGTGWARIADGTGCATGILRHRRTSAALGCCVAAAPHFRCCPDRRSTEHRAALADPAIGDRSAIVLSLAPWPGTHRRRRAIGSQRQPHQRANCAAVQRGRTGGYW
jgi:hypothetical protein